MRCMGPAGCWSCCRTRPAHPGFAGSGLRGPGHPHPLGDSGSSIASLGANPWPGRAPYIPVRGRPADIPVLDFSGRLRYPVAQECGALRPRRPALSPTQRASSPTADQERIRQWLSATRSSDSSTPGSCSRRPWRAATPSPPTTSTTWSSCRPSSTAASSPSRRSSSRSPRARASTPTRRCCATWRRARSSYAAGLGLRQSRSRCTSTTATPSSSASRCIDTGFSSVMIDGSHHPYEENVALTKKVVEYAHASTTSPSRASSACWPASRTTCRPSKSHYTQPERGRGLRQEDRRRLAGHLHRHLATAPPSSSRSSARATPDGILVPPPLRFDILEEIEKRIPGFPIVLHGASSSRARVRRDDQQVRRQAQGRRRHPRGAAAHRPRTRRSARSTSTPTAASP